MDVMCNDCGRKKAEMGPEALALGSSVREPGEPLCGGCTSTRLMLVRQIDKIPNTITDILSKRMVRV